MLAETVTLAAEGVARGAYVLSDPGDGPAQVILLDRDTLQPGDSAYVQLRLKEPSLLLSGDSYILRMSAPATTIRFDPVSACAARARSNTATMRATKSCG